MPSPPALGVETAPSVHVDGSPGLYCRLPQSFPVGRRKRTTPSLSRLGSHFAVGPLRGGWFREGWELTLQGGDV